MSNLNNNFWKDRPTFVTGGTGLVGSWLVKRLVEAGADVVCLIRDWVPQSELLRAGLLDRIKTVRGDLCDSELIERSLGEYEIDTVMHLAAQTIVPIASRNPISTFETNIKGTWIMLESCRRSPSVKQIVVASSDKAYGDHENLPYNEDFPLQGRFPYDVSKSCADLICNSYYCSYKLPVVVTRCGNFYGGGDLNWSRIVPGTIRSLLRKQAPIIRSDGSYIRDYFYVEDGAAAYMLVAEKLASTPELGGKAFNFSNEIQLTASQLVDKIIAAMGSDLRPIIKGEAQNEIKHQYLSAERARKLLGWAPLFELDGALQRTISWYRDYFKDAK